MPIRTVVNSGLGVNSSPDEDTIKIPPPSAAGALIGGAQRATENRR
jgi:hypothetical protein